MRGRLVLGASLALGAFMAPALSFAAGPTPPAAQAFAAVFGGAAPRARVVSGAPNSPPSVTLTVTPGDLVDLGSGRYALVSLEANASGSHMEPGAISIAYLDREAGTWRVEHVWNEFAWTGDSGSPADDVQELTSPHAPPIVFAIRKGVWTGNQITTAWAIVLTPAGPHLAGRFNAGGELEPGNGCDFSTCGAWRYIAGIEQPFAAGALFSVAYGGWREAPGVHRPIPFAVVTNYVERGGALVAVPRFKLPGG